MPDKKAKDCWTPSVHRSVEAETTEYLWRYIQKHSRISTPPQVFADITKLSDTEMKTLATAHLLMSDSMLHFLNRTAPEVLRRLARTVVTKQETSRAGIRGRVNWPETYTRRFSAGSDPSLFVTSEQSSFFDLPENRIFRFLLQQFQQLAQTFRKPVNETTAVLDERLLFSTDWKVRLEQIILSCSKILHHNLLQKCSSISLLDEATISKLRNSRNPYYRELSVVASEFHLCFTKPEAYLVNCIGQHVLSPLDRNILYELAILFRLLDVCVEKGWEEQATALIGGKSRKISVLKRKGLEMHVYYQGLPPIFQRHSAYGKLMAGYGLSDRLRRPDIILEIITTDDVRSYFIVEVKRSEERTYIVDGVYKLLGYLKDYEAVSHLPNHRITGVLVSWSGAGNMEYSAEDPIYITQWSTFDALMGLLVS